LQNRPLAILVVVFTIVSAWLLHRGPFNDGEIAWPVAIGVALVANLLFTYVIAVWASPFLASTGGAAGAAGADPHTVAVAERWCAGVLMLFGSLGLFAITLASRDTVITPTDRLEENAALVRRTVESQAPERYQHQLAGADTWKMSSRTYRTCVPTPESLETAWCVLVQVQPGGKLKVVRYGPGKSNAAQALEWHPQLKNEK
jgi:hypothetical protein